MIYRSLILTGCFILILVAGEEFQKISKTIPLRGEQLVDINIEFNTGKLRIEPTDEDVLFIGEFLYLAAEPEIDYQRGSLDISTGEKDEDREVNITLDSFSDIKENEWKLKLGDNVSYNISIEIGAAEAYLDFSHLKIQNLNITCGASKTELRFTEPNPILMEEFDIEAGVSKFTAFDLLNANFERLDFEGGVGDYELFFNGTLKRSATIKADVSLGSLSIYIPKSVAYRVEYEKSMFCSFSIDNAYKDDDDSWYSDNFKENDSFLEFDLDAGIGIVSVQRIED